jgi:hypothetical protein
MLTKGFAGSISDLLMGDAQDMSEPELEELEKLIQDHLNRRTGDP